MSAGEICSRLGRSLRDRWTLHLGAPAARARVDAEQIRPLLEHPLAAEPTAAEAAKVPGTEKLIERAQQVLSGHWPIFGRTVELGKKPDWLKDPLTGRSAKKIAQPLLGFGFDPAGGVDIRSIWELNRLQALVDLGRAYQITGQPEYAEAVAGIIQSWSAANPYGKTVNWANALEVGLRALSLVQAVSAIRSSAAVNGEGFKEELARLLYLHGRYVYSHLARGSTAFNHLAGEAAALTVLGHCLPGLPGAGKWKARGERALARSIDRLILPDGGGLEGSLHYLALVCRMFVLACRLTGDCSLLDNKVRLERLAAAYRFCCVVTDGGRSISEFGDSDDATVSAPAPAEAGLRYRTTLNQLFLFLSDCLPNHRLEHNFEPDLDSLWLFGSRALVGESPGPKAPDRSRVERFGFSGRYVVRWPAGEKGPSGFLRFECGLWGAARTWGHAHADRLSFSLFLDGKPVFIDPGTGAYLGRPRWREYFRSTAAHNTATVDGQSQGEPLGPFFWKEEVPSRLLRLQETGDDVVLEGEHYGYRKIGVIHRRKILLRCAESTLELVDTFITGDRHQAELFFNLHPQCTLEQEPATSGTVRIFAGGDTQSEILRLDCRSDEPCRINLHRGEESPLRGWFSPGFMRREPCWQIACSADLQGESSLVTRITWSKPGDSA